MDFNPQYATREETNRYIAETRGFTGVAEMRAYYGSHGWPHEMRAEAQEDQDRMCRLRLIEAEDGK